MAESFAFRISGVEPNDAAWKNASESLRREFWRAVVVIGLQVKDKELAQGLDRHGVPMIPISQYTREHRRSAMGQADPNAPALTPAYGLSRTRSLLTGRAHKNFAEFFWKYDEHTGKRWGKILGYHRSGAGRLPKRDVIGISPRSLTEVRYQAQIWWDFRKRGIILEQQVNQFQLPTPPVAMPAKIPVVGRTDFDNFTFGINGDLQLVEAAAKAGTFTGFRQFHPDGSISAAGKPVPSKPTAAAAKAHVAHVAPPPPKFIAPRTMLPASTVAPRPIKPFGARVTPPSLPPLPPPAPKPKPVPQPQPKPTPKPPVPAPKPKAIEPIPAKPVAPSPPPAPNPKPTAPPPPTKLFPDSLADLEFVKRLGGSTGALLARDKTTGKLFVRKAGSNPGHLREESYADEAYRALGVHVPGSRLYDVAGTPVKVSEFLEGKTLAEVKATSKAAYDNAVKEIRKGFVADALLGNWDVVGLGADNILVLPDGRVVRIDNGGSLRYRAQGSLKPERQWSGEIGELESMRDPKVNPSAAAVFGGLTQDEIREQAKAVLAKRDALLKALPEELRTTMATRLKTLENFVDGKPAVATQKAKWTPRPARDFPAFKTAREMEDWGTKNYRKWAEDLPGTESRPIKQYAGDLFKEMNGLLRGTLQDADIRFGASRETIQEMVDRATDGLSRGKTPEDIGAYRGVKDFSTMGFASLEEFVPGAKITERGFSSVTLSQSKAKEFAYSIGTESPNPVVFKVHVPQGSTGGYLNAGEFSGYDDERELLFPPGAEYRVVEVGRPVEQQGRMIPVVVIERVK